jgi:hypothetical protein
MLSGTADIPEQAFAVCRGFRAQSPFGKPLIACDCPILTAM